MSNPWFRMYSEFSHDPKVQSMSEAMQRRYLMLMCMRCSNDLVTLQVTEIAFYLRITEDELAETKALFITKRFIDENFNLLNWEKRQFSSDTSNARVAKHRALQKEKQKERCNDDVTLQKQKSNALDTDTDTDTDTEYSPDLLSESKQEIETQLTGFSIPLNDSTEYRIPVTDFEEWEKAYLAVDVPQELREIRTWSLANKAKRKTKSGVNRFIVNWLAKAQDTPSHQRQFRPQSQSTTNAWDGAK